MLEKLKMIKMENHIVMKFWRDKVLLRVLINKFKKKVFFTGQRYSNSIFYNKTNFFSKLWPSLPLADSLNANPDTHHRSLRKTFPSRASTHQRGDTPAGATYTAGSADSVLSGTRNGNFTVSFSVVFLRSIFFLPLQSTTLFITNQGDFPESRHGRDQFSAVTTSPSGSGVEITTTTSGKGLLREREREKGSSCCGGRGKKYDVMFDVWDVRLNFIRSLA